MRMQGNESLGVGVDAGMNEEMGAGMQVIVVPSLAKEGWLRASTFPRIPRADGVVCSRPLRDVEQTSPALRAFPSSAEEGSKSSGIQKSVLTKLLGAICLMVLFAGGLFAQAPTITT